MNCPKCNGEGKRMAGFKEGNASFQRIRCKNCDSLYFVKIEESQCDSEDFYKVQRKYENDKYRRKCMRKWQTV